MELSPKTAQPGTRPKFDWYETDDYIVVGVMVKQVQAEKLHVEFKPRQLIFDYNDSSDNSLQHYLLDLQLNGEINPEQSQWKVSPFKVEIKMRKTNRGRWSNIETASSSGQLHKNPSADHDQNPPLTSESAKDKMKCWDKLVKEFEKEDEKESGVEELFRRIYASGDENLRRAMNKSFVESNGTVLSTNWDEVSKNKVEVKPPESCQYKQWNE